MGVVDVVRGDTPLHELGEHEAVMSDVPEDIQEQVGASALAQFRNGQVVVILSDNTQIPVGSFPERHIVLDGWKEDNGNLRFMLDSIRVAKEIRNLGQEHCKTIEMGKPLN